MSSAHTPHIINASTNLLGICFVVITALKLSGTAMQTFADETCIVASVGFMFSCIASYLSIRTEKNTVMFERAADYIFLVSMFSLFAAVLLFAKDMI